MGRLLFIGPIIDCTGNKSTALRIKSYFGNCMLKNFDEFEDAGEFINFINNNKISYIICLHAFRSRKLFENGCPVPYAVIFGGTDINVFSKEDRNRQIMSKIITGSRAVVVFNRNLRNLALKIWPEIEGVRMFVIPQAVTCTLVLSSGRSFILKKYPFLISNSVFTLVAGLRHEKDPQFVVSTFQEWHDSIRTDVLLIIIGSKLDLKYSEKFLSEIKKYPSIRYLNGLPQDEIFQILRCSVALVNSSTSEGMSNSILEAMFLGVPVVARDIDGNRALIKDGHNGLLYHTVDEFIVKANQVLEDLPLRDRLIMAGKQYVSEHHNSEDEKKKYFQLLHYLSLDN